MKITFVVPALNLTGGSRVIAMYANLLAEQGHRVTVVSPADRKPTIKEKLKSVIKWKGYKFNTNFDSTFFETGNYQVKILNEHRSVENDDVDDGDIVIATFWYTAEWVKNFSSSKGKKIYFIQHYETHQWLPLDRVEATLKADFYQITVAQWIADILISKYNKKNVEVIGNGVDLNQFFAPKRTKNKQFTVGVMYADELSFKGCDTSLKSVVKAREQLPEIKLVAFAMRPPVASLPLPENSVFYLKPEQEKIKDIYAQCDVWLFGSRSEGCGLPLLEAMACRTPVIATKAGAAPELISPNAGRLIEIDDVDAMTNALVEIGSMGSQEWEQLSDRAYEVACKHDWKEKASDFEKSLRNKL
jgi:glycosyltransferase involved in cell wall biosynthesis